MSRYTKAVILITFHLVIACIVTAQQPAYPTDKKLVLTSVDRHSQQLINISDQIWHLAEPALKEFKSSKILADYAEAQGFKVNRGVAEMPTAFIAEYGSGRPIIGILGEFDALPGLSQKSQPYKEPLQEGGAGHGCGHNLFGAGSIGAAIAVKEWMVAKNIPGTIRFYGTPAEEDYGGKVYMARAGLFDDLDICLDWHPESDIKANMQSTQAVIDFDIIFKGKSAHAATDPWNGKSALDAAELFNIGINFFREHIRPSARMHYVYKEGGKVPNVIPDRAVVWLWLRDSKRSQVRMMEERMIKIAEGAALMAGVEYDIKLNNGNYEVLVNEKGARTLQANLNWLGGISYSKEELEFAEKIMKEYGVAYKGIAGDVKALETTKEDPVGGSTDVGDVSYIVPQISLLATTMPVNGPQHSWVLTACSGMSIGHKGMLYAAKALSATMVDLFLNKKLVEEIKAEFKKRKGNEIYKAILPEGPPPVPDN